MTWTIICWEDTWLQQPLPLSTALWLEMPSRWANTPLHTLVDAPLLSRGKPRSAKASLDFAGMIHKEWWSKRCMICWVPLCAFLDGGLSFHAQRAMSVETMLEMVVSTLEVLCRNSPRSWFEKELFTKWICSPSGSYLSFFALKLDNVFSWISRWTQRL